MTKPALFLLCIIPGTLNAASNVHDDFDFYMGGYIWQTQGKGSLKAPDYDNYNLALDKTDASTNAVLYLTLEHPNTYFPDIKLTQSAIKQSGEGRFSSTTFNTDQVKGTVDLSHTDLTFFYRPVQTNVFLLDLGLTARILYGEMDITFFNTFNTATDLSSTLALVYAKTFFILPVEGLGIGLTLNAGETSTEDSRDLTLHLDYEMASGLGFSGGYRFFNTNLNGKGTAKVGNNRIKVDIDGDLDVQGAFVSMYYHF